MHPITTWHLAHSLPAPLFCFLCAYFSSFFFHRALLRGLVTTIHLFSDDTINQNKPERSRGENRLAAPRESATTRDFGSIVCYCMCASVCARSMLLGRVNRWGIPQFCFSLYWYYYGEFVFSGFWGFNVFRIENTWQGFDELRNCGRKCNQIAAQNRLQWVCNSQKRPALIQYAFPIRFRPEFDIIEEIELILVGLASRLEIDLELSRFRTLFSSICMETHTYVKWVKGEPHSKLMMFLSHKNSNKSLPNSR